MPFQVIDTIRNLTDADIALLKSMGVTGVSRYIARTSGIGKIMGRAECDRIVASGLGLIVNYEQSAGDWRGGAVKGAADGAWARGYVRNTLGLPDSVCIIQSIDTSVLSSELGIAAAYQKAFNDAGGVGNQGCYGPRNVLEHLAGQGLIRVAWEWMGVKGAPSSPVANIRQYRDKPYALPFSYDVNTPITPYYGQFTGQGQEANVPFSESDIRVLDALRQDLKEEINQVATEVWARTITSLVTGGVFPVDSMIGFIDNNVHSVELKVDALGVRIDKLAVGGVDLAALAELVRKQVRAELDKTKLGGT